MNLNDTKIVVAIENAVCDQLEASGIKADPFRLDGEKIVQVILEQLGDYVVVPKEPSERMLDSAYSSISDNLHYADLENIYKAMIWSAQEPAND